MSLTNFGINWDVFPSFPVFGFGYRRIGHPPQCSYLSMGSMVFSDQLNIAVLELGIWPAFSKTVSLFMIAILSIIFRCSKKKMPWIYAGGIIAVVKNLHSWWNWTVIEYPRNSVCLFFSEVFHDLSVPIIINSTCPKPTPTIWFRYNKSFKTFLKGLFCFHDYNYAFA